MTYEKYQAGIKLSGHWNHSGLVHQIELLSTLHQLEPAEGNHLRIDCSEIHSVDRGGFQLLFVWIQCIRMCGIKPMLVNLSAVMKKAMKKFGLETCFSDFYRDFPDMCPMLVCTI
ncbi:MAG: STAS domain-containing protein [Desulfuromonadales bacterium]|nr:STAS domain-containing protein [Desulfuromonadales bacterium]